MAIIKMGALVTQISGKIGGQTLGRSRSGDYIRNTGVPTIRPTQKQVSQRSRLAAAAGRWRLLDDSERAVFNQASPEYPYTNRVGETKFYTGFQIFMQLINTRPGAGVVTVPTPLPRISFPALRNVTVNTLPGVWMLTAQDVITTRTYIVFVSRPLSKGVSNNYVNRYYLMEVPGSQLTGQGVNILDAYVERIAPPPQHAKFFLTIDVVDLATGQGRKRVGETVFYNDA